MATVFRIEKQKNYTVMSNHHLKNAALSLKAKGLLSQMLSLPDDWDYSLKGLAKINKESIDAIRTAVWELEKAGYIVRSQGHGERGKFSGIEYIIYETPQLGTEKADADAPAQTPSEATDKKPASAAESSKNVDTQGISPWLENPTSVKKQAESQPNISPWLDFPTSDNPTSGNPISEQLNTKDIKYINILNNPSIHQRDKETAEKSITAQEQFEGQMDFTQTLAIVETTDAGFAQLLADCDIDCLPEAAQPLLRAALEKMYRAPSLKIGDVTVSQAQIRERLVLLNGDILQSIYTAYLSADKADKPIKNRMGYLISMLYNNVIIELAEQEASAQEGDTTTIRLIERGILDPLHYLHNDNAAIRAAAERRMAIQDSS